MSACVDARVCMRMPAHTSVRPVKHGSGEFVSILEDYQSVIPLLHGHAHMCIHIHTFLSVCCRGLADIKTLTILTSSLKNCYLILSFFAFLEFSVGPFKFHPHCTHQCLRSGVSC